MEKELRRVWRWQLVINGFLLILLAAQFLLRPPFSPLYWLNLLLAAGVSIVLLWSDFIAAFNSFPSFPFPFPLSRLNAALRAPLMKLDFQGILHNVYGQLTLLALALFLVTSSHSLFAFSCLFFLAGDFLVEIACLRRRPWYQAVLQRQLQARIQGIRFALGISLALWVLTLWKILVW